MRIDVEKALVVITFAASVALQSLAALPLVVIPDEATAVEKFAASELAGELGKCLGKTPEIVREGVCPHAPRLYVGATKAAKALRVRGKPTRCS